LSTDNLLFQITNEIFYDIYVSFPITEAQFKFQFQPQTHYPNYYCFFPTIIIHYYTA